MTFLELKEKETKSWLYLTVSWETPCHICCLKLLLICSWAFLSCTLLIMFNLVHEFATGALNVLSGNNGKTVYN